MESVRAVPTVASNRYAAYSHELHILHGCLSHLLSSSAYVYSFYINGFNILFG